MLFKICDSCELSLPHRDFYKHKKSKDGVFNKCKNCCNKKAKERRSFHRINNETTYLYIITHPKHKGWSKIGRTKDITKRLSSYNTGCPFRSYVVELCIEVKDVSIYEEFFSENINSNGYEWFEISVNEAIEIIRQLYNENDI